VIICAKISVELFVNFCMKRTDSRQERSFAYDRNITKSSPVTLPHDGDSKVATQENAADEHEAIQF
jgi:hypothetical protein